MSGPEKLDAGRQHFCVNVRGHDVCVVGDIDPPDRSVGIFTSGFHPAFLFDCHGVRLRALEDQLTEDEWDRIAFAVEADLEEDFDE